MNTTQPAPNAREFLHHRPLTVSPGDSLAEVIQNLLKHKVSNAPVVDSTSGKQVLVGFITEADCLEFLSNELFYGNPAPTLTAEQVMKRHPVCVSPDTNLFALASILASHRLRHVPVVEHDELIGMVSRRDVLAALEKQYREVTRQRESTRHLPNLDEIINHRFIVRGGA